MATPTYTPIASITLGSSASSVTFSSIPQDYRDLVLVFDGTNTTGQTGFSFRFNSDTGTNYSRVYMEGDGSTAGSNSTTNNQLFGGLQSTDEGNSVFQIMDYSATDKHKTCLLRSNVASWRTRALAGRWADTSVITAVEVISEANSFSSGSTFALYGIAS